MKFQVAENGLLEEQRNDDLSRRVRVGTRGGREWWACTDQGHARPLLAQTRPSVRWRVRPHPITAMHLPGNAPAVATKVINYDYTRYVDNFLALWKCNISDDYREKYKISDSYALVPACAKLVHVGIWEEIARDREINPWSPIAPKCRISPFDTRLRETERS